MTNKFKKGDEVIFSQNFGNGPEYGKGYICNITKGGGSVSETRYTIKIGEYSWGVGVRESNIKFFNKEEYEELLHENSRKREELRKKHEEIRLKHLEIDPYGEECWNE